MFIRITKFLAFFICILSVAVLLMPDDSTVHSQSNFVSINENGDLIYQNQRIILKGINFENVNALGGTIGINGDSLGPGDIDLITIVEEDYRVLSRFGANTVRFGLDFGWYQNDRTKFFEVLDQHVEWARQYNIWIVWNMFTTPGGCYEGYIEHCGIWEDISEQEALQNFWLDMADHYKDEEVVLGYDLLNEPNPPAPDWSKTWFDLAQKIYDAILNIDPNHLVFIESTSDPVFDRKFGANAVYEVHIYTPFQLTHADESSEIAYPEIGIPPDLRQFYSVDWAREQKVPLLIGEWGSRSTYTGYDQYIRDMAKLLNEWGVHQTYYGWRHDPEYWHWGVFPFEGDLVTYDQPKIEAMKISWEGAVQPNFTPSERIPGAPIIDQVVDQQIDQDTAYQLVIGVTDADQDNLDISLNSSPPADQFASWEVSQNEPGDYTVTLTIMASADDTGIYDLAIAASDGLNEVAEPFQLNINPGAQASMLVDSSGFPPDGLVFYRGVNLAGEEVTINSHVWEGSTSPDLNINVDGGDSTPWIEPVPEADDNTFAIITTSVEHWEHHISLSNVDPDTYAVYIYTVQTWDNPEPVTFTLYVEDEPVETYTHSPGIAGEWARHGPFVVDITDGVLNIVNSGLVRLAGFEMWHQKP